MTPSGNAAKAEPTRYFLAQKLAEYESLRLQIEDLRRESERGSDDVPDRTEI